MFTNHRMGYRGGESGLACTNVASCSQLCLNGIDTFQKSVDVNVFTKAFR